jgi:SseB protein N-terminal domain/SseB protein C-terminal domain
VTEPERLFRPENELEEALAASAREHDLAPLLGALAEAEVFLPTPEQVPDASGNLPLPTFEREGKTYVPVFTSAAQLARFAPDGTPFVRISGRALATFWPAECSLVFNPGGDLGAVLTPEQVAQVLEAPPPDRALAIGEPREEPEELLEAIRRFAEGRPEIEAAYRGLLVRRGGVPEIVVGLELAPGADETAVIAEAARAAGVESVALVPLRRDAAQSDVARYLLEKTEPFYRRQAAT